MGRRRRKKGDENKIKLMMTKKMKRRRKKWEKMEKLTMRLFKVMRMKSIRI